MFSALCRVSFLHHFAQSCVCIIFSIKAAVSQQQQLYCVSVTWHYGSTSAANTSKKGVIFALDKEGFSSHETVARVGSNRSSVLRLLQRKYEMLGENWNKTNVSVLQVRTEFRNVCVYDCRASSVDLNVSGKITQVFTQVTGQCGGKFVNSVLGPTGSIRNSCLLPLGRNILHGLRIMLNGQL
jgi:hypothetical protein